LIQAQYYHLIDTIFYFIAAVIPLYFVFISRRGTGNNNKNYYLRTLSIVIASFVLMQGLYHVAGILGFKLLAKGILEPLSFALLVLFAIRYLIIYSRTRKKEAATLF